AIELRADVVAHTAVDGHIPANSGNVLGRSHRIDGHACWACDRAARLDHQLRHIQAPRGAPLDERVPNGLDEISWRRRVVIARVRDAEPAARAQLSRLEPKLVAELSQQAEHDVHRLLVGPEREDLRPDMRVQPDQVEARVPQRSLYRLAGRARLDGEPELGVELAGRGVVVGVRLDSRGKAEHDRDAATLGHDVAQKIELVLAVDDDGGAGRESRLQV